MCDVLTASGQQVPEDPRLHNHWTHREICTADVTCSRHATGGSVGGQVGQWGGGRLVSRGGHLSRI